jgi:4,5-DOPA dioxygenase extradiol
MDRMPVLFVGHGNPMNAIEENEFSRSWMMMGRNLPHPNAILCISAHWETKGTQVTATEKPRTIHDFYGFPPALYDMTYPAQGSPEIAQHVENLALNDDITADYSWGLDHGCWSVLARFFPQADIPVLQLSLDINKKARDLYDLGRRLQPLRDRGVLIIGSGNIVHNLQMVVVGNEVFDWALEFDGQVKKWILEGDHEPIMDYEQQGQAAALAINSAEHFKPLLIVLGAGELGEPIHFFSEKIIHGSLSMRSVRMG